MNAYEATINRRTVRKFKQDKISVDELKKLVNAARMAPQGANIQPLKYIIVTEQPLLDSIFSATAWAGYLRPNHNPKDDERPVAYIVVLADTDIKKTGFDVDAGAAIENMLLTAFSDGIGTCWLGAINKDIIKDTLDIPERFFIHSLIALGYPGEQPDTVDVGDDGSIKYYKDENGTIHVPKRKLDDVILQIR